jgi:hypothetical protein
MPLTSQVMTEAHATLAMAVGATPASFALTKLLGLPATPNVLRGLSAVMTSNSTASQAQPGVVSLLQSFLPSALSTPAALPVDAVTRPAEVVNHQNLPAELLQRLGLTLSANATPDEIMSTLQVFSRQILRSTENRVLAAMEDGVDLSDVDDLRVVLMKLATDAPDPEVRDGAAALASHIEGQQLINAANAGIGSLHSALSHLSQTAGHNGTQGPAYFALPITQQGEQSTIEMRLWPRDQRNNSGAWVDEEAFPIRATVRLTLSQMGRIQIDIAGDLTGYLHCQVSTEKPAVGRLIARNASELSESLAMAGWGRNEITFAANTDWAPLWTGGQALTRPRQRVDWRA